MIEELEKRVCDEQVPLYFCLDLYINFGFFFKGLAFLNCFKLFVLGLLKFWIIAMAFLLLVIFHSLIRRTFGSQSLWAQFLQVSVK